MNESPLASQRLVVVEADLEVAHGLSDALRHHGVGVLGLYPTVRLAQLHAPWERVTAAVVDYQTPDVSGDHLISWLHEKHPHIFRVLTTSFSNGGLSPNTQAQAQAVFRKPFSVRALTGVLCSPRGFHVTDLAPAVTAIAATRSGHGV